MILSDRPKPLTVSRYKGNKTLRRFSLKNEGGRSFPLYRRSNELHLRTELYLELVNSRLRRSYLSKSFISARHVRRIINRRLLKVRKKFKRQWWRRRPSAIRKPFPESAPLNTNQASCNNFLWTVTDHIFEQSSSIAVHFRSLLLSS